MATHTPTGDLLEYPIRIIDTHTLDLETDTSLYAKHYAILSHTWLQAPEREVVFDEVKDIFAKVKEWWPPATVEMIAENYAQKPAQLGIIKLLYAIDTARKMKYRYLWVDSCCNDQSNQKELQKALVSMGLWYSNAHVCFVFLEKCSLPKHAFNNPEEVEQSDYEHEILHNRWYTRGWTLQEIIMCRKVIFHNKKWEPIMEYSQNALLEWKTEMQNDLWNHMSFVTFLANVPLDLVCVGQRPDVPATRILSLTIYRQTTRPEDRAYSLMGILGVQMEAQYGEGLPSALERLCHSITGPERKSVLDWLDKVKRSDEPEQTRLNLIYIADVQAAKLNAVDLKRALLALAKHEKESGTVGTTYQFECSLNIFGGAIFVKEPIQIIVDCPLAEIQDVLDRTTLWIIAKLPHTKWDLDDIFLCSLTWRKRAQIKNPNGCWFPNRSFVRRLYMVTSFQESSLTVEDLHGLYGKCIQAATVNWEGGFNDQHAGLGKGKNITQDLHRYLHRCREQEAAALSLGSAAHVVIPWIPEEGSGSDLQIYRYEDMDQGRQSEDAERENQCIAERGRALNTRFEAMRVFEESDDGNDDGDR